MKICETVIFTNKTRERKCVIKSFREGISKKIGVLLIWDNKRWHTFGEFWEVDTKLNKNYGILQEFANYIGIELHTILYNISQSLITADSGEKERIITYDVR